MPAGHQQPGSIRVFDFADDGTGMERDDALLALDAAGDLRWQRTYGGADYDIARDLYLNAAGDLMVGGYTGSYGSRPAFDIVAEAMGGMMDLVGFADKPPSWTIYLRLISMLPTGILQSICKWEQQSIKMSKLISRACSIEARIRRSFTGVVMVCWAWQEARARTG